MNKSRYGKIRIGFSSDKFSPFIPLLFKAFLYSTFLLLQSVAHGQQVTNGFS